MSVNSKMTAIANAIRAKTGGSGALTLDQMAAAIASIEVGSGKTVSSITCTMLAPNGKLFGDINNDGVIDDTDEELAGETAASGEYDAAVDFDGDGEITTSDLIQLSSLISSIEEGQIIVKVDVSYSDGTKNTQWLLVEAPERGIDTSDATATAPRILAPYTAYANDEKITGTMRDNSNNTTNSNYVQKGSDCIYASTGSTGYFNSSSLVKITYEDIRNALLLTADMIASGNTVLGLEGTAESGIDTSDATSTAARILAPYTAYAKGVKLTGTMRDNSGTTQHTAGSSSNKTTTGIRLAIPTTGYYSTSNHIFYSNVNLANLIGLTADKLVKGNTVIGVVGTAEVGTGSSGDAPTLDGVEFKYGSWLQTSDSASSKTITHGLGRTPTSCIVWALVEMPVAYGLTTVHYMGALGLSGISSFNASASDATTFAGPYVTANSTNIVINLPTNAQWMANTTYCLIAF